MSDTGRLNLEFLTPEEFDDLTIQPRDEGDLSTNHLRGQRGYPRNCAGSERTGVGGLNIRDAETEVQQSPSVASSSWCRRRPSDCTVEPWPNTSM